MQPTLSLSKGVTGWFMAGPTFRLLNCIRCYGERFRRGAAQQNPAGSEAEDCGLDSKVHLETGSVKVPVESQDQTERLKSVGTRRSLAGYLD